MPTEDQEQHEEELSAFDSLYRINNLVWQAKDSREALGLILDEVMRVFSAATASISLINLESRRLEIEAARGLPEGYQNLKLPLGHGITGWVALHGQPILCQDVSKDTRYFPAKSSIQSELAVPMVDAGRVVGVVSVDSEEINNFSENDLKLLTLLASEATRAVSRLWHMQQLQTKAEQLQALVSAGQGLVTQKREDVIWQGVLGAACEISECEVAMIYLYKRNTRELELAMAMDRNGPLELEETLHIRESSIGTAVQSRRQVEVAHVGRTEEHHLTQFIQSESLVSMLVTPLLHGSEVQGVLNVYTQVPHRFSNEERTLFQTLATMGSIALQNSRLYQRVFETESTLRQSEKMNTLGLMAAEIAHEIRNPLTVIRLLFDPLEEAFEEGDERGEDVRVIRDRLDQLEEIVTRVLDFGKSSQSAFERIEFNQLIEDTYRLLRLKLDQARVEWEYTPNHLIGETIEAHRGQLQQVLLNLSLNAMEAMPEGGKISVSTESTELYGTKQFMITFRDTGRGIPKNVQGRIFDSFLSRKVQGTGLGLTIIKRILREHRGDVELVKSSPGETIFRFWLPVEIPENHC
jgi:signal transduction histidine kinase